MKVGTLFILFFLIHGCGKSMDANKNSYSSRLHQGISEEILLETTIFLKFDLLPLEGSVFKKEKFWSGDSWRLTEGAINYRWNGDPPLGLNYPSPSSRQVSNMSLEQLKTLSPSEKYDLYMGRYDYPLKNEVNYFALSGIHDWEGLCHGWAAASLNHEEPKAIVKENPDGIEIPFGSSDIKALLTFAYSKVILKNDQILGKRCEMPYINDANCNDDLSAMSFHAVTANKIGLRSQAFIADIDRYEEVWNHPVVAYESKILSRNKSSVVLSTKISYVDLSSKNSWGPQKRMISYMTMKYELDLDSDGMIVNGRWLSEDRPDFLWKIDVSEDFEGYLSGIKKLLK